VTAPELAAFTVGATDRKGRDELHATLKAMEAQTHFEVLGVGAEASAGDVDQAYEVLAREFHPDRFRLRSDDVRALALKIFDRLGEAQAVLRDPGRRRRYQSDLQHESTTREREQAHPEFSTESTTATAAEQVYFAGV